jgi:vacuolar-type H+-ATPase subunit F/Vma7
VPFHIIADQDTVLGFRFAGVTGTAVTSPEAAATAFAEAKARPATRILLLSEQVEKWIEAEVTAHRLLAEAPFVVVLESIWGPQGERKSIEAMIYEAVGIRIVGDEAKPAENQR